MTIREPTRFSAWRFFMSAPDGTEFSLSEHTLPRLVELVVRQLAQFEAASPGFTSKAREEAKSLHYDWERYISLAVQHQICVRLGGVASGICWRGTGDKIHEFMKGIDDKVEKAPSILRTIGQGVTKTITRITSSAPVQKFGKCISCGGSKTFNASKKNLGRVAKFNKKINK